jgi:cytochrome c2
VRARLRRSSVAAAAAGAAVAAAVAVLAGCGTGGPKFGGDAANGKKLFLGEGQCAGCHTLADAGSKATIGPNLDDAFRVDRQQGFKESGIQQVVLDQIRLAQFGMPANLVTGQDAADVAAYVAQCAAAKCNVQGAAPPAGSASGPGGKGQSLFSSLGCQSCHSLDGTKSVGPTLKGIFGSTVEVAGGKKVKADEAYLIESIRDPDKQIAAGYMKGVMSAAIKPGSVSEADAKAIVDFLKQQK